MGLMPILKSSYIPRWWLRHGHVQTLWPVLFRDIPVLPATRVRVPTPDNDALDVDVMRAALPEDAPRRAVVLTHGLEGNARRKYMQGMARVLLADGWDVLARHLRGCGGTLPRTPAKYHMGETDDLHTVTQWAVAQGYGVIALAGFSMGGSQTLKYLGENPQRVPQQVKAAACVSVPCDLPGASHKLAGASCAVYMAYFMRTMHRRMRLYAATFPDFPSVEGLWRVRTFDAFDGRFTAPLNGYASALDYWTRASCGQFLHGIGVPTFLLNAADDPFMTPSCHPYDAARDNPQLFLEVAEHGGHVGFVQEGAYYSELRVAEFLRGVMR